MFGNHHKGIKGKAESIFRNFLHDCSQPLAKNWFLHQQLPTFGHSTCSLLSQQSLHLLWVFCPQQGLRWDWRGYINTGLINTGKINSLVLMCSCYKNGLTMNEILSLSNTNYATELCKNSVYFLFWLLFSETGSHNVALAVLNYVGQVDLEFRNLPAWD